MALLSGHRFPVSMADAFPHGLYALGVEQAMDYDAATKRRTPSKDKQTGELVWSVSCIDRDPEARVKQFQVKVTAPYCPEMPPEIAPDSGIRPIEFSGMTVTPYVDQRGRLALSYRATGVHARGKSPERTQGNRAPGQPAGDGKAA
jgi:hypothetical protein